MNALPEYFQFWIVLITVPNLIAIGLMVVVFALLVLVPVPRHLDSPGSSDASEQERGA